MSQNSHTGYSYKAGFEKLLADYVAKVGIVTFVISYFIEDGLIVDY